MKWSENTKELAEALASVQTSVGPVVKNATNPHFGSHYATLEAVWRTVYPLLADQGVIIVQGGSHNEYGATLITELRHIETGQWVQSEWPLYGGKTDAQGIGSAITYMRRYSLCAMLGLMLDDDDGNGGSRPPQRSQPRQQNNSPQRQQRPVDSRPAQQGRYDPNRTVIVRFKPERLEMPLCQMGYGDAEEALDCARWRIDHPGNNQKYRDKNIRDAQEDARQLEAYIADKSNT